MVDILKNQGVREAKRYIKSNRNRTAWRSIYKANYRRIISDFGQVAADDIKSEYAPEIKALKAESFTFDPYAQFVQQWIANFAAKKITAISDTTSKRVNQVLNDSIGFNLSVDDIASALAELYDDFDKRRAFVIARTEVAGASNFGIYAAGRQAPFETDKSWVNSFDDRVRETHDFRQTVGASERFRNGLLYPGDPNGSAKEVIQCRCTLRYRRKRRARNV